MTLPGSARRSVSSPVVAFDAEHVEYRFVATVVRDDQVVVVVLEDVDDVRLHLLAGREVLVASPPSSPTVTTWKFSSPPESFT